MDWEVSKVLIVPVGYFVYQGLVGMDASGAYMDVFTRP